MSTTQSYSQPRLEDLVAKVLEHHARPRLSGPMVEPGLRRGVGAQLLGLHA